MLIWEGRWGNVPVLVILRLLPWPHLVLVPAFSQVDVKDNICPPVPVSRAEGLYFVGYIADIFSNALALGVVVSSRGR